MAEILRSLSDTLTPTDVAAGTVATSPRRVSRRTAKTAGFLAYALKTSRPTQVDWYRVASHYTDLDTGRKTTKVEVKRIRKAVVMPMSLGQKAWQLDQIQEFQRKGFVERNVSKVLIDPRDLGTWPDPTTVDWLVFDDSRWEIVSVDNYRSLYVVTCVETVAQEMSRIEGSHNGLLLDQVASAVVE